jgi:hypothetical protein
MEENEAEDRSEKRNGRVEVELDGIAVDFLPNIGLGGSISTLSDEARTRGVIGWKCI